MKCRRNAMRSMLMLLLWVPVVVAVVGRWQCRMPHRFLITILKCISINCSAQWSQTKRTEPNRIEPNRTAPKEGIAEDDEIAAVGTARLHFPPFSPVSRSVALAFLDQKNTRFIRAAFRIIFILFFCREEHLIRCPKNSI